MKHLFRSLIALAYLASAATAQAGFVINSFWGAAATISFVGCTSSSSDLTTYTFTDHATGTAGARKTIVGVSGGDGATNFSVSSMTVGGAAATEVADNSASTGSLAQSAIYIKDNPSGTTATIVVTFSEAIEDAAVCVWAAYDVSSETATDTASGFDTSGGAITLDLDVATNGVAVGMSSSDSADSHTWTGMTERSDANQSPTHRYSGADTSTAGTPFATTVDETDTGDLVGTTASFR